MNYEIKNPRVANKQEIFWDRDSLKLSYKNDLGIVKPLEGDGSNMGPTGPTGPQGPQGVQGIAGPQGNQGPIGTTGIQGIQGAQGIQGPAGAVGPAGLNWQGAWVSGTSYVADDAVGYDGASYFCINATSGTTNPAADTANWALLASEGAVGPQGPQGLQGIQGDPGPAGVQGPIGLTGPTGTEGPLGPTGPTGATGPQGVPGPVGPAGLNWQGAWVSGNSYNLNDAVGFGGASYFCISATSGTDDPTIDTVSWALLASQGSPGSTGATGATGPQGATGPMGPQGIPGPVGPAGLNWASIWSDTGVYAENDVVSFSGASYFCYNPAGVGPNPLDPSVDTGNWALLAAQGATGPQGPQGIPGPPNDGVQVIISAPREAELTGTTTETVVFMNYLNFSSSLDSTFELSWGTKRRLAGGIITSRVYINTDADLLGATLIATGEILPAEVGIYSRNVRDFSRVSEVGNIFDPSTPSATDTVIVAEPAFSFSLTTLVDYWIIFTLELADDTDIGYIDRIRLSEYPGNA